MSQFNPNSNPNPNQSPYPYQQQPAPIPPQVGQQPGYGQPQMGQQPAYGRPFPQAPMQNYQNPGMSGVNPGDTGSFGWAVLGFFIPIAGLILWLVWKNTKPQTAIQCRNGFIAGVVVTVLFYVLFYAVIGGMMYSGM
ncbi:hypothetical protein [Varibaculum prostatecancerukia]|uniref:hypothetical protein n=1 Tax=Varibaculum prostatecancerukia TaxID=2811781 RepID=UPI001C004E5F|nr:hypothetical protein [Varibaculum prostatecancerukia]